MGAGDFGGIASRRNSLTPSCPRVTDSFVFVTEIFTFPREPVVLRRINNWQLKDIRDLALILRRLA
jgi:hypothetical protein